MFGQRPAPHLNQIPSPIHTMGFKTDDHGHHLPIFAIEAWLPLATIGPSVLGARKSALQFQVDCVDHIRCWGISG
uniref:Uncharacterized protein n=1 Tax=Alloyangia mangrovi TaxID=1779329 RepID=A0A2A3JV49_9RHOB